jgi:hypothetical protein
MSETISIVLKKDLKLSKIDYIKQAAYGVIGIDCYDPSVNIEVNFISSLEFDFLKEKLSKKGIEYTITKHNNEETCCVFYN